MTALWRLFQATFGSSVSVKYVQGGENRDGFLTDDVDTPFSVADTFESLPSALLAAKSPEQVTTVWDGVVDVVQPLRPAEVGNSVAPVLCEVATVMLIGTNMARPAAVIKALRRDKLLP